MLSLYVSRKAFLDMLATESPSPLGQVISKRNHLEIKSAEVSLINKLVDDESLEFSLAKDNDLPLSLASGVDLSERIIKDGKIKKELSSSVFVLGGINRKQNTENVSSQHGVLCIPDDDMRISDFPRDDKLTYARGEKGSWGVVLSHLEGLPVNSLIINDRFLMSDFVNTSRNMRDILTSILSGNRYKRSIQLLFIFGLGVKSNTQVKQEDIAQNVFDIIVSPIAEKLNLEFLVEFVFCDDGDNSNWPLYQDTHDRFIITNYSFVTVPHSFNAFLKDGTSKYIQSFDVNTGFGDRGSHHTYWKQIADDINDGKRVEKCPYVYYRVVQATDDKTRKAVRLPNGTIKMKPKKDYLEKIQNKMINEIQNGEKCFYLTIPGCNGWCEATVLGPEIYNAANYPACICARTKEEVEILAKSIRALFESIEEKNLAVSENEQFYRINIQSASNVRTIDYVKTEGSSLKNQRRDYKNNYFKDEDYAVSIANEICRILGIGEITKHKSE